MRPNLKFKLNKIQINIMMSKAILYKTLNLIDKTINLIDITITIILRQIIEDFTFI